ncbi:hypothetical protein BLOT_004363, partial [Blomia tropicalis]
MGYGIQSHCNRTEVLFPYILVSITIIWSLRGRLCNMSVTMVRSQYYYTSPHILKYHFSLIHSNGGNKRNCHTK